MAIGPSALDPEIRTTRTSATGVELELRVPESLAVWPGHFPEYFVVPGVLQLDWIVRIAARELGVGRLLRADYMKFKTPMGPGQHFTLSITLAKDGRELGFRLAEGQQVFSIGKLVVEPRVP